MNTCKNCKQWSPIKDSQKHKSYYDLGGHCECQSFIERTSDRDFRPDTMVYSYNEGGSFWTGPDFGCIHWEAK